MRWASRRMLRDRVLRTVAGGEVLPVLSDPASQVAAAWFMRTFTGSTVTVTVVVTTCNAALVLAGGAVTNR